MIIALTILAVIFDFFAGFSKSVADLSDQGELKGNPQIRHKHKSALNKWKDGIKSHGEKFFGSSRWFVMFTDTWHKADLSRNVLLKMSGICIGILAGTQSWYCLFGLLVSHIVFASVFHIFHTSKILKK